MKNWEIIQKLESDNSRLFKEDIIKQEAINGNTEFFDGCKLALDKLVTFGVKQVPIATTDGTGLSWEEFTTVLKQLETRQLTGNAAKDAITTLMDRATADQWNNWYRRILIKDLRCGVSEKTVNNVVSKNYPDYAVPVFTCQLAHDGVKYENKVNGIKYLDTKLDGVRLLTIVYPDGVVYQYSRNGKELLNFGHIKEQFSSIASYLSEPYVFDGEIMSSSFQDLLKMAFRKYSPVNNDAVLYLFDALPLADFHKGISHLKQSERYAFIDGWYEANENKLANVRVVSRELVDLDSAEGHAKFIELNKIALDNGYEGIMVKDPDAFYTLKRSFAWLKIKPFIEVSLEVIGYEEGTGRNVGKLGALIYAGTDDDVYIEVNVGGGYSDKQREEFWEQRENCIGMIGEVRADAITTDQTANDVYSLRFPRFRRFRGFEKGEKL